MTMLWSSVYLFVDTQETDATWPYTLPSSGDPAITKQVDWQMVKMNNRRNYEAPWPEASPTARNVSMVDAELPKMEIRGFASASKQSKGSH